MTPEQKFAKLYKEMWDLCQENDWGDPFSYARAKEIYATCALGHSMPGADAYSGADGINEKGEGVEYKSTIGKNVKGAYTGISVKPTWAEQDKYLFEEKIAKYPEHYYNRFENGELVESWRLDGQTAYEILQPKVKKKYPDAHKKADPRLSATVTNKEIKQYGTRVI